LKQPSPRAVFDSVIYVQALISRRGPAAECIERVKSGEVALFTSDALLEEAGNVPLRPSLTRRFSKLTPERVGSLMELIRNLAFHIHRPPKAFSLIRDPKDEMCIDLAVAASAQYLVTWNRRHLTNLMQQDTPEGKEFCQQFPWLTILDPPAFLHELDISRSKRS
jgi:putative PIN family toxin of toxin-antitoxin system